MKVLWLTDSPAGASNYVNQNMPGRGWIAALGDTIKLNNEVELAVCFFSNTINDFKFVYDGITYYPIKDKLSTKVGKILSKLFQEMYDSNLSGLLRVVDDYKPDVIHLFGTETGLGELVGQTKVPIIIHIQGLVNPILFNWTPRGFSMTRILVNSSLRDLVYRRDLRSGYVLLKKMAKREESIIKNAKYFFGRTDWDKRVIYLMNSQSQYFYCNEVLRPFMYQRKWVYKNNGRVVLISIMNPQIYKGLDIILETAQLLKHKTKMQFEWNIIGLEHHNRVARVIEKVKRTSFKDNSIFFKGVKQGDELVAELLESDLFVHCSHIDNSANSVCEAMLLGMPVVASNVGGTSSLIKSGFDGICYSSQDTYDLASIILKTAFDIDELKRLGANARETALVRHDKTTIASTVLDTYVRIIDQEKQQYT